MTAPLVVDFAGERVDVDPAAGLSIGRDADLVLDDNPYLHRHFLRVEYVGDLWWLANVGGRLSATLTDGRGLVRSQLAPGARLPLVFSPTTVTFSAGATTYELIVELPDAAYQAPPPDEDPTVGGETTVVPTTFTPSQTLAILALAEPQLRRAGTGASRVPTAVEAARRLGWAQTRFNRKLDNVCDKLTRAGVRGLHGGPSGVATSRRAQLVEYAVSTLLVTHADLPLLDAEARANASASTRPPTRRGETAP